MLLTCCARMRALLGNNKAQGMIEYTLMLAFVVIIVTAMYYNIGTDENGRPVLESFLLSIKDTFYHIANIMKDAVSKI